MSKKKFKGLSQEEITEKKLNKRYTKEQLEKIKKMEEEVLAGFKAIK